MVSGWTWRRWPPPLHQLRGRGPKRPRWPFGARGDGAVGDRETDSGPRSRWTVRLALAPACSSRAPSDCRCGMGLALAGCPATGISIGPEPVVTLGARAVVPWNPRVRGTGGGKEFAPDRGDIGLSLRADRQAHRFSI